ncbi:uncharacterized protein LOC134315316 [Trichomycterus rosablanca]|uniref:uncharacterized protein LOC134315316 n=1 Tax=Trichomycterus rosablanca TaxID=2290929 RepID=UPI002F35D5C4
MARFGLTLLFILSAIPGCNCESETVWTVWRSALSSAGSLCENAHKYLVSLVGKDAVDTLLKTIKDVIKVMSEATASALNVAAVYITELLTAAGLDFDLPVKHITPEGVIFVAQWALLAVIGYWLLSLMIRILVGVVRQTLFWLKVGLAVAAFVMILSDTGASTETTATRLAALVLVSVLLGVGPSCFRGDTNAHLEEKVKRMERRLGEVENKMKEQ